MPGKEKTTARGHLALNGASGKATCMGRSVSLFSICSAAKDHETIVPARARAKQEWKEMKARAGHHGLQLCRHPCGPGHCPSSSCPRVLASGLCAIPRERPMKEVHCRVIVSRQLLGELKLSRGLMCFQATHFCSSGHCLLVPSSCTTFQSANGTSLHPRCQVKLRLCAAWTLRSKLGVGVS